MKKLHEMITELWSWSKSIYQDNPTTADEWRKVIRSGNDLLHKYAQEHGETSNEYIFVRKMVTAIHAYVEADLKEGKANV